MTTIADLATEIYSLTKRPDLVAETNSAIKSATLKAHQVDFFERDLFEATIDFGVSGYFQTFPYKTLVPLFRSPKYFRKYDPNAVPVLTGYGPINKKNELTIVTPDALFDDYGVERTNVAYLSGVNYNLKFNAPYQYILMGCYLYPNVTDSGYSSWIADTDRYVIIAEALRRIFKLIGQDAEAAAAQDDFKEKIQLLISSNIPSIGS